MLYHSKAKRKFSRVGTALFAAVIALILVGVITPPPVSFADEFPADMVRWSTTQRSLKVDFKVRDTIYQEYRLYLADGANTKTVRLVDRKDYKGLEADFFKWDFMDVAGLKDNTKYTAWIEEGDPKQAYTIASYSFTTPKWPVTVTTASDAGSIDVYFGWDKNVTPSKAQIYISSKRNKSDKRYVGAVKGGDWRFQIKGLTPQTGYYIDVCFGDNTWWSGYRATSVPDFAPPTKEELDSGKVKMTFGSAKGIVGDINLLLTPTGYSQPVFVGSVKNNPNGGNVSKTVSVPRGGKIEGVLEIGGKSFSAGFVKVPYVYTTKPQIESISFKKIASNPQGVLFVNAIVKIKWGKGTPSDAKATIDLGTFGGYTGGGGRYDLKYPKTQIEFGKSPAPRYTDWVDGGEIQYWKKLFPYNSYDGDYPVFMNVVGKNYSQKATNWVIPIRSDTIPSAHPQQGTKPEKDPESIKIKAPKSLKSSKIGPNTITLSWKIGQKGMKTQIFSATSKNGPWEYVATTSKTSVKLGGLLPGTKYYFKAVHFKNSKATSPAAKKSASTKSATPGQPKGKQIKTNSFKIDIPSKYADDTIKRTKTAVYISEGAGSPYRYALTASGAQATLTGLSANTEYSVRLQDVTNTAEPSAWSKAAKVKTKAIAETPKLTIKIKGSGKAAVKVDPQVKKLKSPYKIMLFYADNSGRYVYWGSLGDKSVTKTITIPIKGTVKFLAAIGEETQLTTSLRSSPVTVSVGL